MEHYTGGSMYDMLISHGAFNEDVCKNIFKQLVNGIDHLHNAGVAHCDIKLENVVVKAGQLRLIDFEQANSNALDTIKACTMGYKPPETTTQKPVDPKRGDIYTAGVCLFMLLYAQAPFGLDENDQAMNSHDDQGQPF